jgi:hypothetical protein
MAAHTEISKKSFKERCSFHTYTGWDGHIIKHNVIYFDYQETEKGRGFKYAVALDIKDGTKAELFEAFYQWICKLNELPWYIRYKCAETDEKRFRVNLSLNW